MERLQQIKKTLQALWRTPWVLLFALFIAVFTLLDMSATNRARSEMENRPLKQRPKLSWAALMSGSYDEDFDSYINDQFVFRDTWIAMKSVSESLLQKQENNGVVYGKDGYLFGKFDKLDRSRYDPNVQYILEFLEKYPKLPVTVAVIPNSYAVLTEKLPYGLPVVNQKQEIESIYAQLPQRVPALDFFAPLEAHAQEYIYYRTDHHWTSYGAYLAAQAYARQKGMELPPLQDLPAQETEGFYGTHFSKAKKAGLPADTLAYYDIPVDSVIIDGKEKGGLYDLEKLQTRDKYAAFLWGNNNTTVIRSSNNRYHQDGKTSRVLLIKDSYGNSFAPFLTYLYDEIHVVDLRYMHQLSGYLESADFDDILLMYNFESLATDTHIATLRY